MKRIAALGVLIFAASGLGFAPVNATPADVTGKTFNVTVVSSFGTTFTDCFRFDSPAAGDLTIDGLGQTVTYGHGQLDAVGTRFKAVSRFGQPLSIMFYGEETTALTLLNGEAVSEAGATFVYSGPQAMPCVAASGGTSPYVR
jgi:hypothetical protein